MLRLDLARLPDFRLCVPGVISDRNRGDISTIRSYYLSGGGSEDIDSILIAVRDGYLVLGEKGDQGAAGSERNPKNMNEVIPSTAVLVAKPQVKRVPAVDW